MNAVKLRIITGMFFLLAGAGLFLCGHAFSQEAGETVPALAPETLKLVRSAMCEGIEDFTPRNEAIVFSVSLGKVSCFTFFDPVPEQTVVYHNWFHKNEQTTKRKLTLQPPCWASVSSIQLRDADKGPWRVEVTDEKDNLLKTFRFSITD
jgi:hypothetical protein